MPAAAESLTISLLFAAGLISFVFLKPTCKWLTKKGWAKQPFTAQENTVSQTFAMAMTGSSACFAALFCPYCDHVVTLPHDVTSLMI